MKLNDRQTDERYRRNVEDDLLFLYSYFKKTSEKKNGKGVDVYTCSSSPPVLWVVLLFFSLSHILAK